MNKTVGLLATVFMSIAATANLAMDYEKFAPFKTTRKGFEKENQSRSQLPRLASFKTTPAGIRLPWEKENQLSSQLSRLGSYKTTPERFRLPSLAGTLPYRALYDDGLIVNGQFQSNYALLRLISLQEFEMVLDRFFQVMRTCLEKPEGWLDRQDHLPFLLNNNDYTFIPYAEKLLLPSGSKCICKGDLHGDIHSLMLFIQRLCNKGLIRNSTKLTLEKPVHLIFHGDYVDRGLWGVEVLYTLMLLKIANPQLVHLVRGNHEDIHLAAHFGFQAEFFSKFHDSDPEDLKRCYKKIANLYNYLPLVLYLGSGNEQSADFVQCCHGGIELGYNPQRLLKAPNKKFHVISSFKRLAHSWGLPKFQVKTQSGEFKALESLCEDFVARTPTEPYPIGFLWNDFVVNPTSNCTYNKSRGMACNKDLTQAVLRQSSSKSHRLCAIIRAHQHNPSIADPMMNLLLRSHGCARLWDNEEDAHTTFRLKQGMVITLLLSPDSLHGMKGVTPGYPGFTYDTTLLITTGATLNDWRLKVSNTPVYNKT